MDARITKLRLSRMLSYDWLKILFATAAVVVVWLLVFTMTGTAIMPSQQFTVINYVGNVKLSGGDFNEMNASAFKDGVFSYEVIEQTVVDLALDPNSANTLLQARSTTEEGDVLFVADDYDYRDVGVKDTVDETTGETVQEFVYESTYLENFVRGYFSAIFDINEYLDNMKTFVGQYYADGDYKMPSELDEQKIKNDFNARTKKDKRYKKSAARAQGEKDEVERIKKYRDALVKFEWYLDNGVVMLTETLIEDAFGEGRDLKGTYSINICPSEEKGGMTVDGKPAMSKLMNAVAYRPLVEKEGGLEFGDATANDMNVCLFDFGGVTDTFEYESLCYIVYVIDTYSAEVCPDYIYA